MELMVSPLGNGFAVDFPDGCLTRSFFASALAKMKGIVDELSMLGRRLTRHHDHPADFEFIGYQAVAR